MKKTGKLTAMLLTAAMLMTPFMGAANVGAEELEFTEFNEEISEESILPDDVVELSDDGADYDTAALGSDKEDISAGEDETSTIVINEKKYTVKFDRNGGDCGKMAAKKDCIVGKSFKLPANKYARAGYQFKGWNTKKNGKGKSYGNKASVKDLTTKDKDTVTLYAQWKKSKKKSDFILKDTDLGDGALVTVRNNTSKNYKVIIRVAYYVGNTLVGSDTDTCDCLQSKTTCALRTKGIMAGLYDSYTVKIDRKEKHHPKTKCYGKAAKVSYKLNSGKNRADVTLTKLNKNIKNAEVAIVFYKGKKVIGYDVWDEFEAFRGKKTYKLSFKYPKENGKTVKPTKCKVYLNEAYYYSF